MIPVYAPIIGPKEKEYVADCLSKGWISGGGSYNKQFEQQFAAYCDSKYGITVPNGTAALHLAVASLGIKEGDEVIIPNFTMIACALAVVYTGATPIFVDADPLMWNIDPEQIEKKITKKTKAVMVVHIYGHPCNMDRIMEIVKKHNLALIEDCAEAHGALYKNKKVGSFGNISAFSFYANKIITTGEGGMVITNSPALAERAVYLGNFCFDKERRYFHQEIGFKYHLTNVQAAIGLGQLQGVEDIIKRKREIAHTYNALLKDIPGIQLPYEAPDVRNVYWMYGICLTKEFGVSRDIVKKMLFEKGIDTRFFFTGMHKQPPLKKYVSQNEKFPVSESLEQGGLYLPCGLTLTKGEQAMIVEVLRVIQKQADNNKK